MTDATMMRVDEAARLLHLSESTLNRWRSQGKGPEYLKIGGRVLYDRKKLVAFVDSCTRSKTRGE